MTAVWVRARAELRQRWRATLLLMAVVGLAGGAVMAAVAGARRTDSAMDRFLAYSRPMNISMAGIDVDAVRRLPQVADADEGAYMAMVPSTPSGAPDPGALGSINPWATVHGRLLATSERPLLVRGRLPDPTRPLEVAVDETLAAGRRLGPGQRLRMWAYTPRQFEHGPDSSRVPDPAGPAFDFTVTGIVRQPNDLSPVPVQQDVIYLGVNDLYLTPAFWRVHGQAVANLGVGVAVRLHRTTDRDAFTAAVRALPGGNQAAVEVSSDAELAAGRARRAMRFQAVALLAFAVLTAIAGLLVVGQSVARQVQLDAAEQAVLRAVGMTRSQLVAVTLVRVALVGAGGALLAATLAVLASPLAPIGLARQAEVDPGLAADVPVLTLGVAGVLVAVLVRGGLAAWWVTRTAGGASGPERASQRTSLVVDRVARAGATPSAVTGIRLALEPGRGESAAPVRTVMVGAVVAVAAIAASLAFAASLDRLVRSPDLQGWNWDLMVGNPNDEIDISAKGELLAGNPMVGGYSLVEQAVQHLDVGGITMPAMGLTPIEGSVLPRLLDGREPRSADEIALGGATLRRLGRDLGDDVPVAGPGGRTSLRIVGRVLLPEGASHDMTMSAGAVLTVDGLRAVLPDGRPTQFAVDYAPGADLRAAYASLRRDFGPTVLRPVTPDEVENLRRVSGLPFLLAGLLAVLGAATLGHLLVTSVRRRRRDLAVLKTLGFLRRQVSATVAWQATTLAALALLVGLPVGVAAGRWAWMLVNQGLGSPARPVTPTLAVLAVVPATVLAANLVAALPARAAAATRPAVVLRSE